MVNINFLDFYLCFTKINKETTYVNETIMKFIEAKEARDYFHVTGTTLRNWATCGRIKVKRISNRKFLYDIDSFNPDIEASLPLDSRMNVVYARVSTTKQNLDLNEQIETIKKYCLCHGVTVDKIYKDVASGMNENRNGFNELISDVIQSKVKTVYITFKDRLIRFGFEQIKSIFGKFNTDIVILDDNEETSKTFQDELTEDLISIIHHFSMKMYANRRKKLKDFKKILEEEKVDF